jgi:hypothetical protein
MGSDHRLWRLAVGFLVASACVGSFAVSGMTLETLRFESATDIWFEADVPRIVQTMTSADAETRSTHHPVFALTSSVPTRALMAAGVEPVIAVRVVLAAFSGAWALTLFLLLRTILRSATDAALFTAMGLMSASMVFFAGVPETFIVGSLTIMWALRLTAADEQGKRSKLGEILVNGGTLAISITNWMFGVLSAFVRRRAREAATISLLAFVLVATLWIIQSRVFDSSEFFVGASYLEMERGHLLAPESGGPARVLAGFFAHPMVMPAILLVDRPSSGQWPLFLTQLSSPGSAGAAGVAALASWGALLAAGLFALIRLPGRLPFRVVVGLGLTGQLILHLVFGNETFFYSLHWVPLFVVLAALASLVPGAARPVRLLAAGFCILAGWNNVQQLGRAIQYIDDQHTVIARVAAAERREIRQQDPWPRAPRVIETPGSRDDYDFAAYEDGGALWPAHSTFNVAFWITNLDGQVVATSHSLPAADAVSRLEMTAPQGPRIDTVTPFYRAAWQHEGRRAWRLDLQPDSPADRHVYIVIRGVGWQYSRIRSITRQINGLLINGRWRVTVPKEAGDIRLGIEDSASWPLPPSGTESVTNEDGWAFARIGPIQSTSGSIQIRLIDEAASGSIDTVLGVLSQRGRRIP